MITSGSQNFFNNQFQLRRYRQDKLLYRLERIPMKHMKTTGLEKYFKFKSTINRFASERIYANLMAFTLYFLNILRY